MRKIDVIWLGLGLLVAGVLLYALFSLFGLSGVSAGLWSQAFFMVVLLGWIGTYVFRVTTSRMTFNTQRQNYRMLWLARRRQQAKTPETPESSQHKTG